MFTIIIKKSTKIQKITKYAPYYNEILSIYEIISKSKFII